MTQTVSPVRSQPQPLSVPRGAALYVGALLGPGLLLLPGLAAAQAGPASILAWLALLGISGLLAVVFAALGKAFPSAGGVTGYAAAGLGPRAGAAAGWCFLAGVICGAPVVCLIGASYVADLTGGGQSVRCGVAAALLLVVLGLALGGVRATTTVQLVLVGLLITVVVVAVAGSAPSAHAANWAPFAPHGWPAIGRAASTLMLSFVGWEAVAPLTARFGDPARQLPRVIAIAFAITTALYLGLAVATIAVLGPGAGTEVPLADLLRQAVGPAGRAAAAVAAVLLTLGATNAYLSGAAAMAAELTGRRAAGRGRTPASERLAGRAGQLEGVSPAAAGPDRRGGPARDRALRDAGRQHGAAGRDSDHPVPRRLPGLHALCGPDAGWRGPPRRPARGARGRRRPGVLRVGARDRRGGGRDGRAPVPPVPGEATG